MCLFPLDLFVGNLALMSGTIFHHDVTSAPSLSVFGRRLKTELFRSVPYSYSGPRNGLSI